jgi:hypothetical protein
MVFKILISNSAQNNEILFLHRCCNILCFIGLISCLVFVACVWMQKTIASPGRGILAMDESNATCGKRLASIGLENTEANRQAWRTLLVTVPSLGEYISGAILFEETLYQSTVDGRKIVDVLIEQNIVPGIKVDKVKPFGITFCCY